MTGNKERKACSPLFKLSTTHHLCVYALTLLQHKLPKSSHPAKCWACSAPTHLSPSPRLSGFGAAAQPQNHSETATNITSSLCHRQAVILIKGAKFLALSSSLSSHLHFLLIHLPPLSDFLNSSRCHLLSFLTSSDPQGLAGARLEAHHTILCHLWCNVSLWQMMGLDRALAQKRKVILGKKTRRGTFPGIN